MVIQMGADGGVILGRIIDWEKFMNLAGPWFELMHIMGKGC